jgi:hypothetical protein
VSFALIVTVTAMAASGADATVSCYMCNSIDDPNCNDPFKAVSSIKSCSGESCYKAYGTYHGKLFSFVQSSHLYQSKSR